MVRGGSFDEALRKLSKEPELWTAEEEGGHSLLHWAALFGNVAFLREALKHIQVDARAHNKQTPLMWAMTRGHVQVAKLLLQAKADPYAQDSVGASPLILAVQHYHLNAVLLLFALCQRHLLLAGKDWRGCNVVSWAAYKGDINALQLLIYFDADFTVVDDEKMTPLHRAAQGQHEQIFRLLLDRGVDPSVVDVNGRTCLEVAQQVGHKSRAVRKLQRLLELQPSKDPEMGKVLVQRRSSKDAEHLAQRARRLAPASFWLCCVSVATFEYLTELQTVAWQLTPRCAQAFEIGVPLCLLIFAAAANKDPGKVPPRVKGNSAVEEVLRALQQPGDSEVEAAKRLCTATFVLKDLRTKYCKETKACVKEFDHFCGWLGTAIGQGNHRLFMLLVVVEVTVQWLHFAMCFVFLRTVVSKDTYFDCVYYMVTQYPFVVFVMLMHFFSSPGIAFLLANHVYMVAVNMTTNEMINSYRYDHFWEVTDGRKVFKNPFNKGVLRNCLDFWWYQDRSPRIA